MPEPMLWVLGAWLAVMLGLAGLLLLASSGAPDPRRSCPLCPGSKPMTPQQFLEHADGHTVAEMRAWVEAYDAKQPLPHDLSEAELRARMRGYSKGEHA